MSKAVFFCVGTGGHVLPVVNIVKTISKKGINESDILKYGHIGLKAKQLLFHQRDHYLDREKPVHILESKIRSFL